MVAKLFFVLVVSVTAFSSVRAGECTFSKGSIDPPTACNIVCSYVDSNADGHPGRLAAQLAVDNVENCNNPELSWEVFFESCTFPEARLDVNWFSVDHTDPVYPPIYFLKFVNTNIATIDAGVFGNYATFKTFLRILVLSQNAIVELTDGIFSGLEDGSFQVLKTYGTDIKRIDSTFITPVSSTIQYLDLQDIETSDPAIIANLTGSCQPGTFDQLKTLSFSLRHRNSSQPLILSNKWFTALSTASKLESLYMMFSRIKYFEDKTVFESINSDSLDYIALLGNMLTTIPEGAFDAFIGTSATIKLEGNPWHCDCHLEYLAEMFRTGSAIDPTSNLVCSSPASQELINILDADLTTECEPLYSVPPVNIVCS